MSEKISREDWRRLFNGTLPRPVGEDFYLFQILCDMPSDPCWAKGFDVTGNWQSCCRSLKMTMITQSPQAGRLAINQGDKARRQLELDLAEERLYQEQRRAQPNN